MSGLSGKATFECVKSKFSFNGCFRLWQKMATQILDNAQEEWVLKRCSAGHGRRRNSSNLQFHVGRQFLDYVTLERKFRKAAELKKR